MHAIDAEFDISWSASDSDDDLDTAELTLNDDTNSETEDSATIDISGGSASGTTTLKAKFDEGTGAITRLNLWSRFRTETLTPAQRRFQNPKD